MTGLESLSRLHVRMPQAGFPPVPRGNVPRNPANEAVIATPSAVKELNGVIGEVGIWRCGEFTFFPSGFQALEVVRHTGLHESRRELAWRADS